MQIMEAVLLGAIQGLTEFLPVSSSGHLVLLQKLFGISEDALLFDTMVHAGTLAAVFAVLWKDIWAIIKQPVQPLTGYLIIATIPAVIAALFFKDKIEGLFSSARFLGAGFFITAALLLISDLLSRRQREPRENITALDALVIGCLQAIALVPGVSRSGATLSGALSRGVDRDRAARFSFLLSIPAILGALVLQLKDLGEGRASIGAATIAAGALTAALVGFFSVKLMLKLVKEHRLWGFAVYTALLGAVLTFGNF
jgi:undecaprenyl-diphosphatase